MKKISAEQVAEWKAKHGAIYQLPIEDKVCYLREPKMFDWKRAFTAMQKSGDVAFGEEMLSACWLAGDEEIKTNDDYFLSARKELTSLFNYGDPIIVKNAGAGNKISIADFNCVVRVITREDLKLAEKKNPSGKPFVTQENLFDLIVQEQDEAFKDKDNANVRFPLYQAIETLQNQKTAQLKKL